jgi:hypothetical protein
MKIEAKSDLPLGQFVLIWKHGGKLWSVTLCHWFSDQKLTEYDTETGLYSDYDVWSKYQKIFAECEHKIIREL